MVAKKKKAVKKAAKASVKKATAKKAVKKTATAKKATAKKAVVKKAAVKKAAAVAKPKAVSASKSATAKKPATPAKAAAKKPAPVVAAASKKSSTTNSSSSKAKLTSTNEQQKKKVATSVTTASDDLSFGNYTPYDIKTGEDYMNAEQVEHFRKILLGWKRELMDKIEDTMHHLQDEAANFPDPNDRASQESEFTLELRTRDRERKLIKKIDESLQALDDEEYGYCTSCGIDIGVRRLEARPTATQCIDCKTLNEIREKQYGK